MTPNGVPGLAALAERMHREESLALELRLIASQAAGECFLDEPTLCGGWCRYWLHGAPWRFTRTLPVESARLQPQGVHAPVTWLDKQRPRVPTARFWGGIYDETELYPR